MNSSHLRRPLPIAAVVIATVGASSTATLAAVENGGAGTLAVPFEVQSLDGRPTGISLNTTPCASG